MLSGIWGMLISFFSNIAKTEVTTACIWSRFYFIEEFDYSSITTCSNVISLHTLPTLAFFYLFERGYPRSCEWVSRYFSSLTINSVSFSHHLCFTWMYIFRDVNICAGVCMFMHTWRPQVDLGLSITLHLIFFFF